jgi:hypothetical protein
MALIRSDNVDASQSMFNNVQGSQTNTLQQTFNFVLFNFANESRPASSPKSRESLLTPACRSASDAGPTSDTAARLIVEIVQALMDPKLADHYQDLKRELGRLQQTITLTEVAIRIFEFTSLGQSLVEAINQEIKGCCVVLNALHDAIKCSPFPKSRFGYIWGSSRERASAELAALRKELFACQKSLGRCLGVLDS